MGGNLKYSPVKEVEVIWLCDLQREEHCVGRRALGMEVGPTRKEKERKTCDKTVGQCD